MSNRSLTAEAAPAKAAKKAPNAGLSRHAAVAEAPLEFEHAESSQLRGNPALVRPNRDRARVLDDDEARAFVTRWLVDELAPLLGLDPSRVEIHVNGAAEARVNARGASGLMEDGQVYLHPDRYDPRTARGRYLLAHETAHVAQRSLTGTARVEKAEAEAHRIGESFAKRSPMRAPKVRLPQLVAAGDKDAPAAAAPPPALSQSVEESRFREIGDIKRLLGGWWVSDGDVFGVLEILEAMSFDVGVAVIQALTPGERYDLVNNINPPHLKKNRRQVLECYFALEPEKFQKFDQDLFEEMDLSGLDDQEQEAAFFALSHLPRKSVAKLLKSDNRVGVEGVINAPALDDKAKEKLRAEQLRAAEEESKAAETRRSARKDFEDSDNGRLLDEIRSALGVKPKGNEKLERPHGHAVDALNDLAPLRANRQQLQLIGELMEDEGLIDRLLDQLPAKQRFDTPEHRDTLLSLMATRLPTKNAAFAESLLSYGLFDWRISDDEAEFAYRLIKFLPLTVQQRFRRRDHGKWLLRIEAHVAREKLSKFKGDESFEGIEVGETKDGLIDLAHVYAVEAHQKGYAEALDKLKKGFQNKLDEASAADLHRQLTALATPGGDPKDAKPGAQMRRMEAIVRELDRDGSIDKLFGALSDKFLFAEENRLTTLRIMVSRDPVHVANHARELVDRRFFHLVVNDREAWLAFQLIRALPDSEREAFIQDEPDLWGRIQSEMSKGMSADSDLNMYVGDKGGLDRASVLGQLTLAETWSGEKVDRLDGLIRMAIAMTEYKFVFEESKAMNAAGNPKLAQLVDDYRLWDPKVPRTEYNPKEIERTKWYEEGIFAVAREVIKGVAFLAHNDFLVFMRPGHEIDLNEAFDVVGGDIGGVQLARRGSGKNSPKQKTPVSENANKVTLSLDTAAQVATASLPELAIASINIQSAGGTYQAGGMTVKNLRLRASYDSAELEQPTQGGVKADRIELTDVLAISRGAMTAIKRIVVGGLRVMAGDTLARNLDGSRGKSGKSIKFPFLTAALAFLNYISKIQGLRKDPKGELLGEHPEGLLAAEIAFDSLEISGVTTSGGQYVAGIQVSDFALRAGRNKSSYLRAKAASLDQRIKHLKDTKGAADTIGKLSAERDQASKELERLLPDEKRFIDLRRKATQDQAHFTAEEKKELDGLQKEMIGGLFVDIGGARISGISGKISADDIDVGAIHGEGKSAGLALAFATDAEMIQRLTAGEHPQGLEKRAGDASPGLEIEKIETGNIAVRAMPTPLEIQKVIDTIDDARKRRHNETLFEDKRDKLEKLLAAAYRYESFAAIGVSSLKAEDREIFDKDYNLLANASELIELAIQHVRLDDVHAGLDIQGKSISVGAGEARVTGIEAPLKGRSVQEIHARGLRGGLELENLDLHSLDLRSKVLGASAGADLIEIKGVKDKFSGIGAEEITLKDLGVDATRKDKSTTLGVHATQIEVKGVSVEASLAALRYQRKKLLDQKKLPPADQKKLGELNALIEGFEGTMNRIADAESVLASGKATDAEKADARKRKQSYEETLAFLQKEMAIKRLTINDLNIEVSGLGDVLDPDFDSSKDKIKIQGGVGKEGKRTALISGASVEGADTQHGSLGGAWIESASVGAVRGSVTYSADRIDFDGLQLDRLELGNFSYRGPGVTIWGSRGKGPVAVVSKLSVTGHVETPLVDEKAVDGDHYMSRVVLDQFHIDSIQGNGLHYRDEQSGLEVELRAATLRQIDAQGVTVNLPKSGDGHLLIQGGTAGIGALENARIAATTASGMAVNTQVDATGLHAAFADDGAVTVDLATLGVRGTVKKQKDLDVEYNAKARGLHVQLIPGKQGYGDATKKYSVKHLDELSAKGKAAGTEFDVKATGGSIGEVTDDGRTIVAPQITLPDIKVNSLLFENDKYRLEVPKGSPVSLENTEVSVKLERNQDPKTKEDKAFSRIAIPHLHIPKVKVQGLNFAWKNFDKGKDLTVTLPPSSAGSVENVDIKATDENPDGLVLDPTKDWSMLGKVGFTSASLPQLTAQVPGIIDKVTADVGLTDFSIGFLSDGTKPIDLKKLTLTNVAGDVAGSKFFLSKGHTRYTGSEPGATAEGIHYGKDGLSIDSVGVNGLKYEDKSIGLTLDIESATLPKGKGFKMPAGGPVDIPRLDIQNAFFQIDDLMKMGSSGPSGGPGTKIDPKAIEFLDHLDGDINAMLTLETDYWTQQKLQTEFPIVVHIRGGQLDYATLADRLLTSRVLRSVINFTVRDDKLVIEFDPSTLAAEAGAEAGALIPGIGPILGGLGGYIAGKEEAFDVYSWQLPPGEVSAAEAGQARVTTLAKPFLPTGAAKPKSSGPSWVEEHVKKLDIAVNNFDLSLKAGGQIDLADFTGGSSKGVIKLGSVAADAVSHLTVTGDNNKGFAIGLTEGNVGVENLEINTSAKKLTVNVPSIHIGRLADAGLSFQKGLGGVATGLNILPHQLHGTVTSATAENITVDIADKGATK